jgi:hypothetical protein
MGGFLLGVNSARGSNGLKARRWLRSPRGTLWHGRRREIPWGYDDWKVQPATRQPSPEKSSWDRITPLTPSRGYCGRRWGNLKIEIEEYVQDKY